MNSPETRQLLFDIEKKDRHFRSAVTLFSILLIILTLGIIALQNLTLSRVNDQLKAQKLATEELKKDTHDQLAKQTKYILCIAKFFTIKDRTNTTIQSLDDCVLTNGAQVVPTPPTQALTSPQGAASTPTPAPASPSPTPQPTPTPTPAPPSTIVGIPLCVPIINACVRQ